MRQAILVVGTGRSGTSAMAGTLRILGADLGDEIKPGDAYNSKGYFENTQITALNKEVLADVGMSWYVSPPERVRTIPVTAALSVAIQARVAKTFGEKSPIAIKDPRFCVLLDAYVSVLRSMGYEVHCVRMVRDPIEVAKSLIAGGGADASHWLPMVSRHSELLDAAIGRTAVNCVDCAFADLVEHAAAVVLRITGQLPFLSCSTERMREILDFIDGSLRHHSLPIGLP